MKTARSGIKLLGLAALLLLIAVAMPPRMIWWARVVLVAAAIFALLAANAYFGLSILTGEPRNKNWPR
jgi:hypothetical protein